MRKNKTMRLASGLLVAVLLTTSIISGILAKYTSSATGSDTATAANWSFQVNGTDIADSTSFDIDLFRTVYDSDGETEETDIADVAKLIAPGTSGSFEIHLKNASEVTADYSLSLEVEGDIPLQFAVKGIDTDESGEDFEGLSTFSLSEVDGWLNRDSDLTWSSDPESPMAIEEEKTVTVYWQWPYYVSDDTDEADTESGMAGDSITVSATITATQHD